MAKISAELHNKLNALYRTLKAAHPEINMRPTQAEAAAWTDAPRETWRDMLALSALASTFAGGTCSAADRKRAMRVVEAAA